MFFELSGSSKLRWAHLHIFQRRYFTHCFRCSFCNDWCCNEGADIDLEQSKRLLGIADQLKTVVDSPPETWFENNPIEDRDFPSGAADRINVSDGKCVFLSRKTRGCLLHSYSLQAGIDYHDLKPMVCNLFPLSFQDGALVPCYEIDELICNDTLNQASGSAQWPTLFNGVRDQVLYYYGPDIVRQLDKLQIDLTAHPVSETCEDMQFSISPFLLNGFDRETQIRNWQEAAVETAEEKQEANATDLPLGLFTEQGKIRNYAVRDGMLHVTVSLPKIVALTPATNERCVAEMAECFRAVFSR